MLNAPNNSTHKIFKLRPLDQVATFHDRTQVITNLEAYLKFLKPKIYKLKNQNNWTLAYIHPETNKRIRKRFPRKKDATVYLQELSYSFIQNRENFLKNDKIGLLIE